MHFLWKVLKPACPQRRKDYIQWNFYDDIKKHDSAVAEAIKQHRKDQTYFADEVSDRYKGTVPSWVPLEVSTQKPVDLQYFDNDGDFYAAGAHLPCLIFAGSSKSRRTWESIKKRQAKDFKLCFGI